MNELSPPPPVIGRFGPSRSAFDEDRRGTFRALTEAFVSLFVAVLLFRTFAAEGYMISTGSMAPCLLGFHKRVVCPTCGITFPFGVAYDTDEDPDANVVVAGRSSAICPNCGQVGIDVTDVPKNHGDQLLVNKQAYSIGQPRRWDIVVFRNPSKATEAYVKRVVGLPNEQIQIADGDVFVNGQIARKGFREQLSSRILVNDHKFRPANDENYQPHWQIVDPVVAVEQEKLKGWVANGPGFSLRGGNVRRPDNTPFSWVEYHHWIRQGGQHETSVQLDRWPDNVAPDSIPPAGLKYKPETHEFGVTGALPSAVAKQLLEMTDDPPFQNAVRELYEGSHIAPISDEYGYNPTSEAGPPIPVRDLMVSAHVVMSGGSGEFIIEMTNGNRVFSVVFDIVRREINMFSDRLPEGIPMNSDAIGPKSDPIGTAPWPKSFANQGGVVDFSIFDKQAIIAIDGKPVMPAAPFEIEPGSPPPRIAVRFGARGLDIRVRQLKIYRDIYYTDTRSRHAVNRPFELKRDQYFVLGDNSPVSHDSRRWDNPVVDRSLVIGKPFLVHLPSKPGSLQIWNRQIPLRLPDWERVRFLK